MSVTTDRELAMPQTTAATKNTDPAAEAGRQVARDLAVSVDGVVRRYGAVAAVDGASFDVHDGEVLTLLGPSGCGKSTLLRCLAGIDRIDAGQIDIGGRTVALAGRVSLPPERRHIGMVFQSYALWPHMKVEANVAYPLKRAKVSSTERKRRVVEALEAVHLGDLAKRYPGELSGGQQQRVSLARAIVADPALLLMDEPLSNLDAQLRDAMRAEIQRVQRERGLTMIYVTHDQQEALALSDRILVMRAGRVMQEGSPQEIYGAPNSPYVARFVGESNRVVGTMSAPDRVRLPDGSELTCRTVDVSPGDEVALMFRPGAIRLAESDGPTGTVVSSAFLGSVYEVMIDLDSGERVMAHSVTPPAGARVHLDITASSAYARGDE